MKAKQATAHPKLVTQLERHACFCPPTMHDTKLDQLNKIRMDIKASTAKTKPVPSHKANTLPSPLSGLATIKQPGQATILQTSVHVESKGGSCHQASNQQAAMQKADTKNCLTPMFICQFGMHINVQGHRNANVCKQTYDACCSEQPIPLPSGRADSVSVVNLAKDVLLYQKWTVKKAL